MYALLKFNDELKVNIDHVGLVPLISYYPELWQLYLEKYELRTIYLSEIIKGLKQNKNNADMVLKRIKKINLKIETTMAKLHLPGVIPVFKIDETEKDYIVLNVKTKQKIYIDKRIFNAASTTNINVTSRALELIKGR